MCCVNSGANLEIKSNYERIILTYFFRICNIIFYICTVLKEESCFSIAPDLCYRSVCYARMAELVDALVSNTCGKPCRFDSGSGYLKALLNRRAFLF